MKDGKLIVYLDSDIYITILEEDKTDRELYEGSIHIKEKIDKKEYYLVASLLVNSEVKPTLIKNPKIAKKFNDVLRRSNVSNIATGRRIYALADEIIEICKRMGRVIKSPDAIHLATAIIYEVDEFYTNDEKLYKLDGILEINKYRIPRIIRPPLPAQTTLAFKEKK